MAKYTYTKYSGKKGTKNYGRVKSVKEAIRTKPTAANKAAAQANNKAFIKRKAKYPNYGEKSIVRNSKKVATWGAPKPAVVVDGKRVTSVVGSTKSYSKPVIRSIARTTQTQPIRSPLGRGIAEHLSRSKLPTDAVARRTQVRSNMRAAQRLQNKSVVGRLSALNKGATRALGRVAGPAGVALAAYDAYKALDAYSKTSGPSKQMAKYKSKGGFSHMTSNPKKRGKQGLDF